MTANQDNKPGVVTYRGQVAVSECDQMGHMNVQFYMDKNSQSLARIGEMLGLGSGFYAASERILFEREMLAGEELVMRSGLRKIDGDQLHIASLLVNEETGIVAARFEIIARLWHTTTGATRPLPAAARKKANAFNTANDEDFPPPRPIEGPRLQPELPQDTVITCRRAVNTWEANETGVAAPAFVIACVSDAAMHFFTHMGASHNWRLENHVGSAALDYNIVYHRPLPIGAPVDMHSRFLETREKVFRFSHHMTDATSHQVAATIEVTAVLFDLNKRKAIPLPAEFHKGAKKFGAQKDTFSP